MVKPTLYYLKNNVSPPARTVQLTGATIGVDFNLIEVDLFQGEHLKEDFLKLNPQHTIPTLIDTDGSVLTDSHAISAYLVQKYGKPEHQSLYPKDLVKRAKVDARLHFDSQFLFARFRSLIEPIFYHGFTGNNDDKIAYLEVAIETLNSILEVDPYVAGEHLTIADFACLTTVSSLIDVIVPINAEKYPKVFAWIKRLEQLPYTKDINDIGANTLKAAYKQKLEEISAK